ncbi:atp-binding cassette transporter subfamily a abca [Anaeramoeba flamelloides]|uniref:Atp-binding cassette transporter subfamily a abca n=1 Tax=Anaeramoeba flamelloides TaxID=1746091 RepID=A0ABQ8YWF9_9EUKA|nr:atp-binding cassette transporter subfamily a abca [Anaeramoeba flamelloides]
MLSDGLSLSEESSSSSSSSVYVDFNPRITTILNQNRVLKQKKETDKSSNPKLPELNLKPLKTNDQFVALFKKNLRLQKRATKSNFCQAFVAVIVVLLIFLMQLLVNKYLNQDRNDNPTPKSFEYDSIISQYIPFYGKSNTLSFYLDFQTRFLNIEVAYRWPVTKKRTIKPYLYPIVSEKAMNELLYNSYNSTPFYSNGAYEIIKHNLTASPQTNELSFVAFYNSSSYNMMPGLTRRTSERGQTMFLPTMINLIHRSSFNKLWMDSGKSHNLQNNYGYNLTGPDIRIGLKNFPTLQGVNQVDIVAIVQPFYFTFLLHFLLPVFLIIIVYEKEHKLIDIMVMFGLKMKIYWIVNFIFNYCLYFFLIILFYIAGYALQFRYFTQNLFMTHFLLFFCWGFAMVSFSFFLASFFKRVRTASVVGYFLVIIIGISTSILWEEVLINKSGLDIFWAQLIPSIALYNGNKILSDHGGIGEPGLELSDIYGDGMRSLYVVYLMLLLDSVIYLILASYIRTIFSDLSSHRNPFFFLNCFKKRRNSKKNNKRSRYHFNSRKKKINKLTNRFGNDFENIDLETKNLNASNSSDDNDENEKSEESNDNDNDNEENNKNEKDKNSKNNDWILGNDPRGFNIPQDVQQERVRVINSDDPIKICNLSKIYKGQDGNLDVTAVDCLTLGIKLNECFGILGPNGAGKTTTVNILSGLIKQTSGRAQIWGLDIPDQMSGIHSIMSVCPQHDILWDDQSGEETLEFYARMHGYKDEDLKNRVDQILKQVGLYSDRTKLIKEYSGGMKRRISVACALITNPKVIFLDEPTTGLDPASKRQVWNVIRKARKDRSIILTTHSMEEADSLCDRIGIMANGMLRTIGESQELKLRSGKGFKFMVHCYEKHQNKVEQFVNRLFPNATILNSLAGTTNYEIPKDDVVLSDIFQIMEEEKDKVGILDWGISQTTLEEVFLEITKDSQVYQGTYF